MDEETKSILTSLSKKALNIVKETSPYILTSSVFKKVFYHHTYTDPIFAYKVEYFPNLQSEKNTFISENNNLVGYFYHYEQFNDDQVIIFVHGYGNGHRRYLDIIDYLCSKGLLVFAFDMTSVDESEGDGIYSFPQGIIDLKSAIEFVLTKSKYRNKAISLIGHSWGAYSVSSVLNVNKNIKAVVEVSGFNLSEDIVRAHGEEWAGKDAPSVEPYIASFEEYHYGNYAKMTSLNGFRNSKAKILMIHSSDDMVIPISSGLDYYKENLEDDSSKYSYIRFTNRGHGQIFYTLENQEYFKEVTNQYKSYFKKRKNASKEEKEEYIAKNINIGKFTKLYDKFLLDYIVEFLR